MLREKCVCHLFVLLRCCPCVGSGARHALQRWIACGFRCYCHEGGDSWGMATTGRELLLVRGRGSRLQPPLLTVRWLQNQLVSVAPPTLVFLAAVWGREGEGRC
jgi:hypothetical protein